MAVRLGSLCSIHQEDCRVVFIATAEEMSCVGVRRSIADVPLPPRVIAMVGCVRFVGVHDVLVYTSKHVHGAATEGGAGFANTTPSAFENTSLRGGGGEVDARVAAVNLAKHAASHVTATPAASLFRNKRATAPDCKGRAMISTPPPPGVGPGGPAVGAVRHLPSIGVVSCCDTLSHLNVDGFFVVVGVVIEGIPCVNAFVVHGTRLSSPEGSAYTHCPRP